MASSDGESFDGESTRPRLIAGASVASASLALMGLVITKFPQAEWVRPHALLRTPLIASQARVQSELRPTIRRVPPDSLPSTFTFSLGEQTLCERVKSGLSTLLSVHVGPDGHMLPWENLDAYPLSSQRFQRAYHSGALCHTRRIFHRLSRRLEANLVNATSPPDDVTIDVIGSSMTRGSDCAEPDTGRYDERCSWVSRFEEWLVEHLFQGAAGLRVVNKGASGLTIGAYLQDQSYWLEWAHGQTDMVLADMVVNFEPLKQPVVEAATREMLGRLANVRPQPPSTFYLKTFRFAKDRNDLERLCPRAEERREFHVTSPSRGEVTNMYCEHYYAMSEWDRPVLQELQMPSVSYRDAVWPNESLALTQPIQDYWQGGSHPNHVGHKLVSHLAAYGFLRALDDHCAAGPQATSQADDASWEDGQGKSGGDNYNHDNENGLSQSCPASWTAGWDPSDKDSARCKADGGALVMREEADFTLLDPIPTTGGSGEKGRAGGGVWRYGRDKRANSGWSITTGGVESEGEGHEQSISFVLPELGPVEAPTWRLLQVTYLRSSSYPLGRVEMELAYGEKREEMGGEEDGGQQAKRQEQGGRRTRRRGQQEEGPGEATGNTEGRDPEGAEGAVVEGGGEGMVLDGHWERPYSSRDVAFFLLPPAGSRKAAAWPTEGHQHVPVVLHPQGRVRGLRFTFKGCSEAAEGVASECSFRLMALAVCRTEVVLPLQV